MSHSYLFAAIGMIFSVHAASSATVELDVDFLVTEAGYRCAFVLDCDFPSSWPYAQPGQMEVYSGVPVGKTVSAKLIIAEAAELEPPRNDLVDGTHLVTLTYGKNVVFSEGGYYDYSGLLTARNSHSINAISHRLTWDGLTGTYYYETDDDPTFPKVLGTLSYAAPAPVPLPASAVLLPLGMAGFALVRRRNREMV